MFKRVTSALTALVFCAQNYVAVVPARAETRLMANLAGPSGKPLDGRTAVLDAQNPILSFEGLSVYLTDAHHGRRVLVHASCVGQKSTPALAVDGKEYGANARLLNITTRYDSGCASYRIASSTLDGGPVATILSGGGASQEGLAVSIHHAGVRPSDLVKHPSVFVFNPVHGNWTEAKPFAPAAPETQRVYATLSEASQQVIGGVIALPDSLQGEPARSTAASIGKPLEQVNPRNGYLGIDAIEPNSSGAYGIKLPLLLRASHGAGPSFSIGYSPQGAPGVLGRGWDLSASTIEVRGPSPVYHPAYETEDYVFDGMDLIALDAEGKDMQPLHKGGPIIGRIKGVRLFRLRNNSDGLIVRRYGTGPGDYFWEVWDPKRRVTRLFGAAFTGNDTPPIAADRNGVLKGSVSFGDGSSRLVIGQWGITVEYDDQPARRGTLYTYKQSEDSEKNCTKAFAGDCSPALRLSEVEYNRTFASQAPSTGVTLVKFVWDPREPDRFNSDGRLGFFRAFEYLLRELIVHYEPEDGNIWLAAAAAGDPRLPGKALFARHSFEVSKGDDPCLNFDQVLEAYTIEANGLYDGGDLARTSRETEVSLKSQKFTFNYEGQKACKNDGQRACKVENGGSVWPPPTQFGNLGGALSKAPAGQLGFPSGLLDRLGFGVLASGSLLGTGRSEETGASIYVGFGPPGNTSSKEETGGIKAGVNFSKSEGNSTLVDVTGDGINDIVFRDGGELKYCAGRRSSQMENGVYKIDYPSDRCGVIEGVSDFSIAASDTNSVGVEFYPSSSAFVGVSFNGSENQTYAYFTDRDGDGLVDVVNYGRVLYNQGETRDGDRNVVRFLPRSPLIPPLPGKVRQQALTARVPSDLKETIAGIEAKLAATSRTLKSLEFSQTVLAWEAPLTGYITLSGEFVRGASTPEAESAGPLGRDFDPTAFDALSPKVAKYQDYIARKYNCDLWSADEQCHGESSDPLGPHFTAKMQRINFIEAPPAKAKIWRYSRATGAVAECGEQPIRPPLLDLASVLDPAKCRRTEDPAGQIRIETGDVLYIGYSVHPHLSAWIKPTAKVAYASVDDDVAFNLYKAGSTAPDALPCRWQDQARPAGAGDCLLAQQRRYEFELNTALLPNAPSVAAILPAGTNRRFAGRLELPSELARDYQIFFDVVGESRLAASAAPGTRVPTSFSGASVPIVTPTSGLSRMFRQDISAQCSASSGLCSIEISPACAPAVPNLDCGAFSDPASELVLASRITVLHRVTGAELPVRNISQRLVDLRWQEPPHIKSELAERPPSTPRDGRISHVPSNISKVTILNLPLAMGEQDLEYVRIEQGRFYNPDVQLDDGDSRPEEIFFQEFVEAEPENIRLARLRQTLALCAFARELRDFISTRYSQSTSPYADDYTDYWRQKVGQYKTRCDKAQVRFDKYSFSSRDPETSSKNTLQLPFFLRHLVHAEQLTSAETLLERVLANLALGEDLLTDAPKLTRRGYRLPVNVNPYDCSVLTGRGPIAKPITSPDGDCAYRFSANFSMQDFEDVVTRSVAKNMRDVLARFQDSKEAAFQIDIAATVNGRPVAFRELSGERTGNESCGAASANTCMGTYGSRDPIPPHFYPRWRNGHPGDPHGDVFQRITLNKRAGRAVAFSNSIMLDDYVPFCPTASYKPYPDLATMEMKQDCPVPEPSKYIGQSKYIVSYTIGENNQFAGRNRVLEFRAHPLDVLELHVRLSPRDQTVSRVVGNPADAVTGKFSLFDGSAIPPVGIARERYIIPRDPSQILTRSDDPSVSDVGDLSCPKGLTNASNPLPTTCRPWTRLGWTEILLGAQYRTYSDAQKAAPGVDRFSILRRREILRLYPEIEVAAHNFALASSAAVFPRIKDIRPEAHLAFYTRDPNVWKTGGQWSLFGGKADDRSLRQPAQFSFPLTGSLRYGDWSSVPPKDYDRAYDAANAACGPAGSPNYDACETHLSGPGSAVLALKNLSWFPLEHRFIGPANASAYEKALEQSESRPKTGVCGAELPSAIASCWKGLDDTIYLERAILPKLDDNASYSVSALLGFERPPIAKFLFEFASYGKLVCIDSELPTDLQSVCPTPQAPPLQQSEFPTRPTPSNRTLEVFAPVQSSRSKSVGHNEGISLFNTHHIDTTLLASRQLRDINGDGFPDVIAGDTVELTSPVGLSRRDWWTYFRVADEAEDLGGGAVASGVQQSNISASGGAGVGLSANTAAKFQQKGTNSRTSGSTDAGVDPGFDLSLERGHDERFVELVDFNGDGLADRVSGGTIGDGLDIKFNAGNSFGADRVGPANVPGGSVQGYHFNTNHSAGFGVRLGFSYGAGSFIGGMGLTHRDNGSQAALMDFTGDGRPDIVLPVDGGFVVYPNLGNGFGPCRLHRLTDWNPVFQAGNESGTSLSETTLVDAGAAFTFGFNALFFRVVFNPGIKWAQNQTRELLSIRDINGDGVPDVVAVSGNFLGTAPSLDPSTLSTRVYYNPNGKYHMLAGISNPSGSRWVLRHGLLGNSGPENGKPVWALTGAARFDGYVPDNGAPTLPADGHDVLLTTYEYGKGYYNRAERKFYGFDSITSRIYGCHAADAAAGNCLEPVQREVELDVSALKDAGYRNLQIVRQTFSNRDFLTQGLETTRLVVGAKSSAEPEDEVGSSLQALSRSTFAYTIDDLQTLAGDFAGQCALPDQTPVSDSWNAASYSVAGSSLSSKWDGSTLPPPWNGSAPFSRERPVLGANALCGTNIADCAEILRRSMCDAGFVREQRAFWAQQSGSVRRRLTTLESFAGLGPESGGALVQEPELSIPVDLPRLRSAAASDHDAWGQVVTFNSIGEARADWTPDPGSSTFTTINYALGQGLDALRAPGGVGYPIFGHASDLQVFSGPWKTNLDMPPLRVREALYAESRRDGDTWKSANLSDVCLYPGGEGFRFAPGMCSAFKLNMSKALADGYSSMQDALRSAYAKTAGLPKGASSFDAVVHYQLSEYDEFGNLLHAISPLSRNKEWIERRFDFTNDPFRHTATETTLTRCVTDGPGVGANSKDVEQQPAEERPQCTYGLRQLPDPVVRTPISHRSLNRIDSHFGSVAETRDVNQNRLLFDVDRWGRLSMVARSWGAAPRENRTMQARLKRAIAKNPSNNYNPDAVPLADVDQWRVLAAIDYQKVADGLLRSNIRRFESSDSYAGLLGNGQTTRETATFVDGLGHVVQSIKEADVCLGVDDEFIVRGRNARPPAESLPGRCTGTATGIVSPGPKIDALGRALETFESYPLPANAAREGSWRRFETIVAPPTELKPLVSTTYDGAGRPLLVESRLSRPRQPQVVQGSTQYSYRIVPEDGDRLARFEALSLSPRCTASAVWSDARGLRRTVFEDQEQFFQPGPKAPLGDPALGLEYNRDDKLTRGFCSPIESIEGKWAAAAKAASVDPGGQPARVSYAYDPLQQLVGVDSPLDGNDRSKIAVRFDLLGRTLEMQEPNSGCTRYEYDGLNSLISETGFRHEGDVEKPCGSTSKVRNQKSYDYAAGRMVGMSYHSLQEQGGSSDARDAVRIFYDRSPSAILFGTPVEALRFVPNDQANQRFVDVSGRACDNCIGQATVVSDRTGARAFSFNELGLPRREVRSIVAPLREVRNSEGLSQTYVPEVAFYEQENAYTAFGDPIQERFAESAPTNPANACFKDGVNTCLARFTVGRRYAPDGAVAQLTFNGRPLISAAQDALGRPAIRWTASGVATGYRYDERDLRLNQMTTLTPSNLGETSLPVQVDGFQYDGGGNVLGYANRPIANAYEGAFAFEYDAVNRLTGFRGAARRGEGGAGNEMQSGGRYTYDAGHRFKTRDLTIAGGGPGRFERRWKYGYDSDPREGPVHAPRRIGFAIGDTGLQTTDLGYDDLGRMTDLRALSDGPESVTGLLSNRIMTWDAEGRLIRVRGAKDPASPLNERFLREEYAYDWGGNRALKVHRPLIAGSGASKDREGEAATLYLTPFYARPYDRRGTVQLSQGTLPAVTLGAPAEFGEDPIATYLYSDLQVGSMTAAVTGFGEPTDTNAIVIARREYSPYGLELTTDSFAMIGRDGAAPLAAFHGKEVDRVTQFSSFGARYYGRDVGIWLKPDPMLSRYISGSASNGGWYAPRNVNTFSFAGNNPIRASDPDGNIVDTVLDIGFIVYDVGSLAYDEYKTGGASRSENLAALGADIAGLAIPFATGGGIAVRGGVKATEHAGSAIAHGLEGVAKNKAIGKAGEEFAENLLKERGYEVIGKQMHVVLENNQRMYIDVLAKKGDKFFAVEAKAGEGLLRRGGQNAFYFEGKGIRRFSGERTEGILLERGLKQEDVIQNINRLLHMN